MSRERDLNKIRFLDKLHHYIYDEVNALDNENSLEASYKIIPTEKFGSIAFRIKIKKVDDEYSTNASILKQNSPVDGINYLFEIDIFKRKSQEKDYFSSKSFKNTVAHEIMHAIDKIIYGSKFELACKNYNSKKIEGEYKPIEKDVCFKIADKVFSLESKKWKKFNNIAKEFIEAQHANFEKSEFSICNEIDEYFEKIHKVKLESLFSLKKYLKVGEFSRAILTTKINRLRKHIDNSKKYYLGAPHESNAFISAALYQVDKDIDYFNHDVKTFLFLFENYLKFYSHYDLDSVTPKIKKKALNRAYNFYHTAVKKELADIQNLYKGKLIFSQDYIKEFGKNGLSLF